MARVYTDPARWAADVRRWAQREKDKPILQAIRRAATVWRKLALTDFLARGVGQKMRGDRRARSRWFNIAVDRTKKSGDTRYETGLLLYGMAAHQEVGGMTKRHPISSRKGNGLLVFQATGRRFFGLGPRRTGLIAVRQVNHPGGRVQRIPFAQRTGKLVEPKMQQEVQRGLVESAEKVIG